jgi:TP901-1 family phage major tail protein
MTAKRGSELLLKRGDGAGTEVFTTVGTLRTKSLTFNGNPIDVTTDADVDGNGEVWQTFITGVKTIAINGSGIAKAIEPAQSVYEDFAEGNIVNYQAIVPYIGTWTAPFIVTSMDFNGNHDGTVDFTLSMQAAGAPTFVAETA